MNRSWVRSKAAVVLVGATLMVSACSGDPAPIVTETPTATPSETPSPSPTPSPSATALTDEEVEALLPEDALVEDFWGAQSFTRFFLIESQEMIRKRDSRLFVAISDSECDFCNRSLDSLANHLADDLQLVGGEISIVNQTAQGACSPDFHCHVEVDVDVAASQVLDSSGALVEELSPETLRVAVETNFVDGHWIALGVGSEMRE